MTDFGFDRALYTYEAEASPPLPRTLQGALRQSGRRVTYDSGAGTAVDVDDEAVSSSATRPATPASLPARSA